MSSVFISHSSKDNAFTRELADALTLAGIDVWVDFDRIDQGATFTRAIENALLDCRVFVVVISRAARDSDWVENETLKAMEYGKPLRIVLLEDVPLPLHLANRHYSDFLGDHDQATRKLIASLRKTLQQGPPRRQPRRLPPTPDETNFFRYMENLPDGEENARVARDLYAWSLEAGDRVEFGGKLTPGFHLRVDLGGEEIIICSVWAYARRPAVQVQFQYLREHPPYDDYQMRLSTLRSLDRLLDAPLLADKADRRPTIPLLPHLASDGQRDLFQQIVDEIIENLRSV
jgi:hypothetical protein